MVLPVIIHFYAVHKTHFIQFSIPSNNQCKLKLIVIAFIFIGGRDKDDPFNPSMVEDAHCTIILCLKHLIVTWIKTTPNGMQPAGGSQVFAYVLKTKMSNHSSLI